MKFRSTVSYIVFLSFTFCAVLIWYGSAIVDRVNHIEDLWLNYNKESSQASFVLSEIQSNLGYGGFIHNFKNYILHQEKSLVPVISSNLDKTYQAIDSYSKLRISEKEKKALSDLKHIVDIYSSKFQFAQRLVARGNTPRQIEINVQVNDKPAFQAIDFLAHYSVERSSSKESETSEALSRAIYFLQWGLLSIPLTILVTFIIILFFKKLLRANHAIEDAKQYSDDLIESAPDAWFVIAKGGKIISVNSQAVKLFGYEKSFYRDKTIEVLIPERLRLNHDGFVNDYFDNPRFRPVDGSGTELLAIDKSGREFPVQISLGYTHKDGEIFSVSTVRDITLQKEQEDRLAELAHFDPLTTLPNRALFFDRFHVALLRAKRLNKKVAIFYIDLDGFKEVNDTLGHEAGDKILVQASKTLLSSIREDDTAARLGGDEFVVIFNNIDDVSCVHTLAKRITENLRYPLFDGESKLTVTGSIGVSIFPDDADNEKTLLKYADEMMYRSKKDGKNCYSVYTGK